MEYENIIFEVDFLGAGAADLCAGEFLVPLAAGKLLPPICVQEQEESYDVLKQCLSQMEDLCASREKGYELSVKIRKVGKSGILRNVQYLVVGFLQCLCCHRQSSLIYIGDQT